jgi:hypothetical protein
LLTIGREYGKEMKFKNAEKRQKRCIFCCLLLKWSVFIRFFLAFFWIIQRKIFENSL